VTTKNIHCSSVTINFLGLVIEIEEIKIQEEKVIEVLEWPRPKMVKEV